MHRDKNKHSQKMGSFVMLADKLSVASWLSLLGTRIFTWRHGVEVGRDLGGNIYYRQSRPARSSARERRWVIYAGEPEASLIPPQWHAWLHHQQYATPSQLAPPVAENVHRHSWQKSHQPNLTGTAAAYRPPGHILQGGVRAKATGDYEAWRP
jgi:NADH:ubiquinone oxidoreductase subunit